MKLTSSLFFLLFSISIIVFLSCKSKPAEEHLDITAVFNSLRWLEGSWVGDYNGNPFYEDWNFSNDSLMINRNYSIENGDTTVNDMSSIHVQDHKVYYSNNPEEGKEKISWALTKHTDTSMQFENPKAPYSQTMIFEKTPEGKWKATLITKGEETIYLLDKI